MASGSFVVNRKGIMEVCKSDGMQAELQKHATRIATRASNDALNKKGALRKLGWKEHGVDLDETTESAYYCNTPEVLKYTAVCKVAVRNALGDLAENQYKSLSRCRYG